LLVKIGFQADFFNIFDGAPQPLSREDPQRCVQAGASREDSDHGLKSSLQSSRLSSAPGVVWRCALHTTAVVFHGCQLKSGEAEQVASGPNYLAAARALTSARSIAPATYSSRSARLSGSGSNPSAWLLARDRACNGPSKIILVFVIIRFVRTDKRIQRDGEPLRKNNVQLRCQLASRSNHHRITMNVHGP